MLQRQTNRTAAPPRPLLQRFRAAFAAAASPKRPQNPPAPDATTPAPLDVERERLRADGYTEQEVSNILVAAYCFVDAENSLPWYAPSTSSLSSFLDSRRRPSLVSPLPSYESSSRYVPPYVPERLTVAEFASVVVRVRKIDADLRAQENRAEKPPTLAERIAAFIGELRSPTRNDPTPQRAPDVPPPPV